MKYEYGNMVNMIRDALVITTNGFVKKDGSCVMGRGIAKQIANMFPRVPKILGERILRHGNKVHHLTESPTLISFPVKATSEIYDGTNAVAHMVKNLKLGDKVPGWACKARIDIIEKSLQEIVELADNNPHWKRILIPKVGCGAGELDFKVIKPLMEQYLDDRFICCDFRR